MSFPGFPFSKPTLPFQTSLSDFMLFSQINRKQTAARSSVYILLCKILVFRIATFFLLLTVSLRVCRVVLKCRLNCLILYFLVFLHTFTF